MNKSVKYKDRVTQHVCTYARYIYDVLFRPNCRAMFANGSHISFIRVCRLPDDGRTARPKYVVVNTTGINKVLKCSSGRSLYLVINYLMCQYNKQDLCEILGSRGSAVEDFALL
jgi:hypothetical protein